MTRWFGGALTVLLVGLAGCGVDNQEKLIQETLVNLDKAGSLVSEVEDQLDKAYKKTGGDQNIFLKPTDQTKEVYDFLNSAEEKATDLIKIGRELIKTKQSIDLLKDPLTDEQKKRNSDRLRTRLTSTIERLVNGKEQLQKSIRQFEALGDKAKDELKSLRAKLREADGQFESLNRTR